MENEGLARSWWAFSLLCLLTEPIRSTALWQRRYNEIQGPISKPTAQTCISGVDHLSHALTSCVKQEREMLPVFFLFSFLFFCTANLQSRDQLLQHVRGVCLWQS